MRKNEKIEEKERSKIDKKTGELMIPCKLNRARCPRILLTSIYIEVTKNISEDINGNIHT